MSDPAARRTVACRLQRRPRVAPAASMSSVVVASLVAFGVALGCASQPPAPVSVPVAVPALPQPTVRPLCALDTSFAADKPVRERAYPPGYWLTLLVEGYRATADVPRPARDCVGDRVKLEWEGCGSELEPEVLPPRALTPKDVVVSGLEGGKRLVWTMIDRLSDGEAQGPAAIAEIGPHGIAVRALGVLRAYPQNVALRLEKLGDGSILAADGEFCEGNQMGEECARAVRLIPLVEHRFVSGPMVDGSGMCVGRPFIPVRGAGMGASGEKYHVETLVTFAPDAVLVREQLAIESTQPRRPDAARDSYIKRVQADRQVTLRGAHLVASAPSLLSRWLASKDARSASAKP